MDFEADAESTKEIRGFVGEVRGFGSEGIVQSGCGVKFSVACNDLAVARARLMEPHGCASEASRNFF